MAQDYRTCLETLREQGRLPAGCPAAFVAGSLTRGWGNPTSDLDAYVITAQPWRRAEGALEPVALCPDTIAVEVAFVDGRRWDIAYWLDDQIDQMMEKLSWQRFDSGLPSAPLTARELELLERLTHAVPMTGDGWLARRRDQIHASALRAILVAEALNRADHFIEDTVGQLAAADTESAVLSARLAFGSTVDALLASLGEFGQNPKWRARRVRAVRPSVLSFPGYWSIETMRTYTAAAPEAWIDEVVRECRRIAMEVGA